MIKTLKRLRDIGNTVIVVEHDEATMRAADHIIEMGPGPGVHGGEVVAQGTLAQIIKKQQVAHRPIPQRQETHCHAQRSAARRTTRRWWFAARRRTTSRTIDVRIPLGVFVCITGVWGRARARW